MIRVALGSGAHSVGVSREDAERGSFFFLSPRYTMADMIWLPLCILEGDGVEGEE